jgi:hypothetical protein
MFKLLAANKFKQVRSFSHDKQKHRWEHEQHKVAHVAKSSEERMHEVLKSSGTLVE